MGVGLAVVGATCGHEGLWWGVMVHVYTTNKFSFIVTVFVVCRLTVRGGRD